MPLYPVIERLGKNIGHFIGRRPAIFFTNILLTYRCTQRCLQCTIPELARTHPQMAYKDYIRIIDKLDGYGTQGLTLSGGEPMSHPDLAEMLRYAAGKSFTNIHLLTTLYASEKVIDRTLDAVFENNISLSCSFDGFDQVADTLRGGRNVSERVLAGMEKFNARNKARTHPLGAYMNIVISQQNLYQIPKILELAESIGWKVNIDLYRWSSENHREVDDMKITDTDQLDAVIDRAKRSPNVITPEWLLNGYPGYLQGTFKKYCPYLDNRTLGSKFFIHPNGDVAVCIGEPVGNLLISEPAEIFGSEAWRERNKAFHECRGCWNTCYTPAARMSSYIGLKTIKQTWQMLGRAMFKTVKNGG